MLTAIAVSDQDRLANLFQKYKSLVSEKFSFIKGIKAHEIKVLNQYLLKIELCLLNYKRK